MYLSTADQIGTSKDGVVNGIQITIYCNCGWKMSPLDDAISLVMGHIDNGETTLTEEFNSMVFINFVLPVF